MRECVEKVDVLGWNKSLTQSSIHTTPDIDPATKQHQEAHTERVCWQPPADLLLINGVSFQHCISAFQKADEKLPSLENRRVICLAWSLCGSFSIDYRLMETQGLW